MSLLDKRAMACVSYDNAADKSSRMLLSARGHLLSPGLSGGPFPPHASKGAPGSRRRTGVTADGNFLHTLVDASRLTGGRSALASFFSSVL